jgi:hypothetical protein
MSNIRPSPTVSATKFKVGTKKRGNDGNMYVVIETKNRVRRWKKIKPKLRPSPTESATKFKVGKKMKGNDGNIYIVVETKNKVKRWQKYKKDVMIINKIKKLIHLGSFTVTDKVVVGDTTIQTLNLKSGVYDAYRVDDSLMIVNRSYKGKVDKKSIGKWRWKDTHITVLVDSGYFGFYNLETVNLLNRYDVKLSKRERKISKSVEKLIMNSIPTPFYEMLWKKKVSYDAYMIKGKHVGIKNVRDILPDKLLNTVYGVIGGTLTGDGYFKCYTVNRDRSILIGGFNSM